MHASWLEAVGDELETPELQELRAFLVSEVAAGRGFFPPGRSRLQRAPADPVRRGACRHPRPGSLPRPRSGDGVVLLGAGRRDAAAVAPQHLHGARHRPRPAGAAKRRPDAVGKRGVLLLNSVLTVAPGSPASHAGKGWERFTDRVIAELSARRDGIVFLLWGRYAQQKGAVSTLPPPRPHGSAPVALLGGERVLRLPPLLARERLPRGGRPRAGRLAAAALLTDR